MVIVIVAVPATPFGSTEISELDTVLPTVNADADAESVADTPAVDTEDDESKSWDKINKDD